MQQKKHPIGISDFEELVTGEYYFVDKTGMIADILRRRAKVHLVTRSGRFGKSLNLSMMDRFFNMEHASGPDVFSDLKISRTPGNDEVMNTYPVIRLDLSDVFITERTP